MPDPEENQNEEQYGKAEQVYTDVYRLDNIVHGSLHKNV
jgi:hypothetical protein